MTRWLNRALQLLAVSAIAGVAGFFFAAEANRTSTDDLVEGLDQVPQMQMNDVAYAFAPAAQVKAMIEAEPPQPQKWAHTEQKVELMRKLRLAVVAASPEERAALIAQAKAICAGCEDASLQKLLRLYAQARLVSPGNDIECPDCERKRTPL